MNRIANFSELHLPVEEIRLNWSQAINACYGAWQKIDSAMGCIFKASAAAINNANVLGSLLQGARYVSLTANHISKVSSASRIDQVIWLIGITRIFSDLCYLFSGEFLLELEKNRYGLVLGQLACGISNGIQAMQALYFMIQDCQRSVPRLRTACQDIPAYLADGFAVLGLLGHVGDAIQRLVAHSADNLQDWLDLIAALSALALPLAALAGGAPLPFLCALGILSCLCSVLGALLADYRNEFEEKLPADFAEYSKDLAKFFSTATACLAISQTCLGAQNVASFSEFNAAVKSFSSIRKGLEIINRFKEWFSVDRDGTRFWQKRSVWKVANKIFMAGETLLNFRSFLMAFGGGANKAFLDGRWGRVPVLSVFKTIFSLGAAICAVIDNLIKWLKLRPEQTRLAFKKLQWDVLIQLLEDRFLPSQVAAWNQMQQHLLERYNWKLQKELLRGQAHDPVKVALFRQHMVHISAGQVAAFLSDKQQRHLQRLHEVHANSCDPRLRVAFQAEIDTFQHFSACDFAHYRSTLADNRYHRCCADVAKTSCTIASKAFKAALNLTCLGLEFFNASAFLFIPKYLSLIHKAAAFVFDMLIAAYFKAGEEMLLLSALPGEALPFLGLRRRLRYLQAA